MKFQYFGCAKAHAQCMVAILGAVSILWVASSVAAESGPVDVVKQTTAELFDAVRNQRSGIEADPGIARSLVREHITPYIDLERTSRWVLGKHWRRANDDQRKRFIQQFRTLLVRTYATAITEFADSELTYLPLKGDVNGDDVTVRTQLPQGNGPAISIYYRMHRTDSR